MHRGQWGGESLENLLGFLIKQKILSWPQPENEEKKKKLPR